jgi:hypothetical protein
MAGLLEEKGNQAKSTITRRTIIETIRITKSSKKRIIENTKAITKKAGG